MAWAALARVVAPHLIPTPSGSSGSEGSEKAKKDNPLEGAEATIDDPADGGSID